MSPEKDPASRVAPVSPQEIGQAQAEALPDELILALNGLIAQRYNNGQAIVYPGEVEQRMIENGVSRNKAFKYSGMEFEEAYRQAGWKVEFDYPAMDENYRSHYIFKKRR